MHRVIARRLPAATAWVAEDATVCVDTTRAVEFVDLTGRVAELVAESGLDCGLVSLQTRHTTTGLLVNELEPLLLEDLRETLERHARSTAEYRHDDMTRRTVNVVHDERRNGHAHCQALVLRASESLHVVGGRLQLGRWQRVLLAELDGGQKREVSVMIVGRGRAAS